MAGDEFSIRVSSWYKTNSVAPTYDAGNLITTLAGGIIGGLTGSTAVNQHAVTNTQLTNSGVITTGATDFLTNNNPAVAGKPKAYLNWILFDEQFKFVSTGSGAEAVGADEEFKIHTKTGLPINKSGYLYVYVSNETNNIPVWFDNLQVTHTRGRLLEETHYYPFGLVMQGISSKAVGGVENKKKYNGKELQDQEFSDGSGLEWEDYGARILNVQTGRFAQIDPKAGKYFSESVYDYVGNNPVCRYDPNGMEWDPKSEKQLASINKKIDSKMAEINAQLGAISKSDKDENGKSIYNKAEQAEADELNKRNENLNGVKTEIQKMTDDHDHVFSLKSKKGITHGGITGDPTNLKHVTITFAKGDFGNQLHEMNHGFQVSQGFMSINSDGSSSVLGKNLGQLLEVQAYERQLSYTGTLKFSLSPLAGADPAASANALFLNTVNQINTPITVTQLSQLNKSLIPRMMTSPIGNTRVYPEY